MGGSRVGLLSDNLGQLEGSGIPVLLIVGVALIALGVGALAGYLAALSTVDPLARQARDLEQRMYALEAVMREAVMERAHIEQQVYWLRRRQEEFVP